MKPLVETSPMGSAATAKTPEEQAAEAKAVAAAKMAAEEKARAEARMTAAAEAALDFPTVRFEFDSDVLTSDGRTALDEFASGWKSRGEKRGLLIEGYADERGSEEYNLVLGERRASAVRKYLSRLGAGEAIRTISYGEYRPADPGKTEESFATNRRAEVKAN